MRTIYPEWANEKQLEGMKKFDGIAKEYGDFEVEFTQASHEEESRFCATISWDRHNRGDLSHSFDIAFDYEATWNCYGERLHEWQFLFAGGDATRTMSTEVLFLDIFFFTDSTLLTKEAANQLTSAFRR